jgi:hypothetical protein
LSDLSMTALSTTNLPFGNVTIFRDASEISMPTVRFSLRFLFQFMRYINTCRLLIYSSLQIGSYLFKVVK